MTKKTLPRAGIPQKTEIGQVKTDGLREGFNTFWPLKIEKMPDSMKKRNRPMEIRKKPCKLL